LLPKAIAQRLEVRVVGNSFQSDVAREAGLREAVSAAGLDAVVRFEPFREDTAPLYRWADVVAVPSRLPESLGRVAIEAMAYGRPPLVARIGGLPEVVEDGVTGWVVPPNDANALARTIGDIVNEPDTLRRYGSAARARFEATFAARGITRQFQAIVRARFGAGSDRRATIGLARV
jgi:glycosyltransferase involved in cell wall biosynthesis